MKILIILSAVILTPVVSAEQNTLNNSLEQCRQIDDNDKRLSCYDAIGQKSQLKELSPAISEETNTPIPYLLADLEEPRLFGTYGRINFLNKDINAVLLGVGLRSKLKTINIPKINQSVDFNMIGLIKSQFDVSELDTRNNRGGALINTDFMVGGELVKNFDKGNLRLKYTHQSYHLGDEFLIDNPFYLENRLNLSYETIDLLAFRKFNNWGAYLGASFIVRSEPGAIDKFKLQTGIQFHGRKREWFTPLFGLDLKSWGETDWTVNTSFKAGVEFYGFLDHPLQFMIEYYDGKSPYGQFIYDDLDFFGVSINHYW